MSERISTEDVQEILNNPMQAFLRASIESTECLAADLLDARARIAELEARAPVVTVTDEMVDRACDLVCLMVCGKGCSDKCEGSGKHIRAVRDDVRAMLTAALDVAGTGDAEPEPEEEEDEPSTTDLLDTVLRCRCGNNKVAVSAYFRSDGAEVFRIKCAKCERATREDFSPKALIDEWNAKLPPAPVGAP